MTRLVWITDPHLNHVPVQAWDRFLDSVNTLSPEALLITGDISEGEDVAFQLNRIAEAFAVPVYFVLGNHDFYHSSIADTRRRVTDAAADNPLLHYLTDLGPIQLSENSYLVGEDGWGDATEGNYEGSPVRLNDFARIEDFYLRDPAQWKAILSGLGSAAARRVAAKLADVPQEAKHILVATHVPPYCEACWYEGRTTDENWAPFFVCGEVGKTLRSFSQDRPYQQMTVVCGHTHHAGIAKITENQIVYTGAADYGSPRAEGTITVDDEIVVDLHAT